MPARTHSYWYARAMGPRSTVVVGLVAGAVVAVAMLFSAVILLPEPSPAPTDAVAATPGGGQGVSPPPDTRVTSAPSIEASISTTGFHIGEPAPALSVPQLGGGQIDLASLHGRPVWVNFMQTTCPPCVDEFPLMSGFAARYADSGLVVVAIDIREDEGTVASFVRSLNAQFPIGLDSDGLAAQTWDAVALPVHFWVDANGIIRGGALGGIGPDVMAANLSLILPGVDVTP